MAMKLRVSDSDQPIELRRSRPRDVQLTAAGFFLTMVGAALLIGSVVVSILLSREAARQSHDRLLLANSGVTTSARVERLWRESNDNKTPRVEYTYDVDGRQFDGRSKLPLKWWQALHAGDSLNVRYLPSDPSHNVVVHAEPPVLPAWLPILVGLAAVAGGLGCLAAVHMQRRLLTEGRVARATVTKITKRHTSHGGSYRSIAFTFATLSGATVAGKASTTKRGPDVGAAVWVIYDPDNPKRTAIYPMQLVTLPRA